MSLHKGALNGLTADHHVAFCFSFVYCFPFIVSLCASWAPPWWVALLFQIVFNKICHAYSLRKLFRASVCLWYAFLVQLFCIQGRKTMVMMSRRILPLIFLIEGVSHHSFVLDLNGEILHCCYTTSCVT